MHFIETRIFTKIITRLLEDEDYRSLQIALMLRPEQGPIIRGAGGLRKVRWAKAGSGKRGGIRDLLFVDPYLDAEFVSRYLPHVSAGVVVRLLARERLAALLPAVALLRQQQQLSIDVRAANDFHDRYVFVDGIECYQSGAPFKDGAKKAPTTLTQIVDAFSVVRDTYEKTWASATIPP